MILSSLADSIESTGAPCVFSQTATKNQFKYVLDIWVLQLGQAAYYKRDRIWENSPNRHQLGQNLNFCQKRHLLSLSIACAKYERCSHLCFNATTLNRRFLAIIIFLFWRKCVLSPLLGGA